MSQQDDNIADLQSSAQITDVADNPDTSAVEGNAEPSAAQEGEEPTMLSVVRDVVSEEGDAGSPPEQNAADDPAQAGANADPAADPDNVDYSDVPFHKHPRFQQLLTKAKTNEADANRYRSVENYMQVNNLSAEEAADAMDLMALSKRDPRAALEKLRPMVRSLLEAAGEVLPADLQARVAQGQMPRDAALEVSRAQAQAAHVARQREAEQQAQVQAQERNRVTHIRETVGNWEQERMTRDPQYGAKAEYIKRELAYLQRAEGIPSDAQGALDQLNRAYNTVNAMPRPGAAAPAKQAVRPIIGGDAAGSPKPQPQSMLDAMR